MRPNQQETGDLVTFTGEIFMENTFFCSEICFCMQHDVCNDASVQVNLLY